MVADELIELPAGEVARSHEERARTAGEAWRGESPPPLEPPPGAPEPQPAAPAIDAAAGCEATIGVICGVMVSAGREPVPPEKQALAVMLCTPAFEKYGGDVPYMTEIMAVAGLYLLYKASEPTKKEPEQQQAAARRPEPRREVPRDLQEFAQDHEEVREELIDA